MIGRADFAERSRLASVSRHAVHAKAEHLGGLDASDGGYARLANSAAVKRSGLVAPKRPTTSERINRLAPKPFASRTGSLFGAGVRWPRRPSHRRCWDFNVTRRVRSIEWDARSRAGATRPRDDAARVAAAQRTIGQLPALGVLTLAGMNPSYWTCSYHEAAFVDQALVEAIGAERPDLVAVSALTASAEEAYRLGRLLRRVGLRTVLGGLHATACVEEAGQFFDAVVVGEGEPVWPTVLQDVESGRLQPVYRTRAAFALANTPMPRFDLLGDKPRPRYTLQTQRGCPLACEFCGASRLLGSFREKPAENLVRELQAIEALSPAPLLELADDNTFAGHGDLTAFFEALAFSKARWFTESDWRLGERPELCRAIADAGCVQVLVGLESLVRSPGGMGAKNADWPRILDAIARDPERRRRRDRLLHCGLRRRIPGFARSTRRFHFGVAAGGRANHSTNTFSGHAALSPAAARGSAFAGARLVVLHAFRCDLSARCVDSRRTRGRLSEVGRRSLCAGTDAPTASFTS